VAIAYRFSAMQHENINIKMGPDMPQTPNKGNDTDTDTNTETETDMEMEGLRLMLN
jgi:hypothetical protein